MIQATGHEERAGSLGFVVPPPLSAAALDTALARLRADDPLRCGRLQDRLVQIQTLVTGHPTIRCAALACALNLSLSRLEHCFRELTGQSLGAWLQRCRLAHAAHLLRTTNLRIKEIADRTGYAHPPSFVRAFRAAYQRAPDHWRFAEFPRQPAKVQSVNQVAPS